MATSAEAKPETAREKMSPPNKSQHWASLRIVFLLLLLTASAILFAWIAPALKQQSTVAKIRELGGVAMFDVGECNGSLLNYWFEPSALCQIDSVFFSNHPTEISGETVDAIKKLRSLKQVGFHGSKLSEEATQRLPELHSIRSLNLAYSNIADKHLDDIAGMPNMETVRLNGSLVTANGVKKLISKSSIKPVWWGHIEPEFFYEGKKLQGPLELDKEYSMNLQFEHVEGCATPAQFVYVTATVSGMTLYMTNYQVNETKTVDGKKAFIPLEKKSFSVPTDLGTRVTGGGPLATLSFEVRANQYHQHIKSFEVQLKLPRREPGN